MSSKYDQYKLYLRPAQQRLYEKGLISEEEMERLGEQAVTEFKSRSPGPATDEGILTGPLSPQEQGYLESDEVGTGGAIGRGMAEQGYRSGRGLLEFGADQVIPKDEPFNPIAATAAPLSAVGQLAYNKLARFVAGDEIDAVRGQMDAYKRDAEGMSQGRMIHADKAYQEANGFGKAAIKYAPGLVQAAPLAAAIIAKKPQLATLATGGLVTSSFGEEYGETEGTAQEKLRRAAIGAGIEYGTEKLGIRGVDAVGWFKQFAGNMLNEAGTEVLGDQLRVARDLVIAPELAPKTVQEFAERQADTAIGAMLGGGVVSAVGARSEGRRVRAERTKSLMDALKGDLKKDAAGDFNPMLDSNVSTEEIGDDAKQPEWDGSGEQTEFTGKDGQTLFNYDRATGKPIKPKKPKSVGMKVEDMFAPGNFREAETPMGPDPKVLARVTKEKEAVRKQQEAQEKKTAKANDRLTSKRIQEAIKADPTLDDNALSRIVAGEDAPAATAQDIKTRAQKLRDSGNYSVNEPLPAKERLSREKIVDQLAGDDSRLGKASREAILSKKVKVVEQAGQLPARKDGNLHPNEAGAYFDGESMYIVAKNQTKETLVPAMLHETGHYYLDAAKPGTKSIGVLVGEGGVDNIISKMRANKDNAVVKAALARDEAAGEHGSKGGNKDELVTYFIEEAAKAKAKGGVLGSAKAIGNDIVAATRTFMRDKTGLDLDISLNDLQYLSTKMLENVPKSEARKPPADLQSDKYSLVGPTAKNAERYEKEGRGFEGAVDKKRRYEIDSSKAKLDKGELDTLRQGWVSERSLKQVLNYDELYENYPELANIRVKAKTMPENGEWSPDENTIRINDRLTSEQIRSTLLHEVQHVIQSKEGFVNGANLDSVMNDSELATKKQAAATMKSVAGRLTPKRLKDIIKEEGLDSVAAESLGETSGRYDIEMVLEDIVQSNEGKDVKSPAVRQYIAASKTYDNLSRVAYDRYLKVSGEAEARAVQARDKLTAAEKRETPFYDSLDVDKKSLTKSPLDKKAKPKESYSIAATDDLTYGKDKNFAKKPPARTEQFTANKKGVVELLHPDSVKSRTANLFDSIFRIPDAVRQARDKQTGAVREAQLRALNMLNKVNEELTALPDSKEALKMLEAYDRAENAGDREKAYNRFYAKYPAVAVSFKAARRQIFENSINIADLLSRDASRMTEKDKAMVAKINENLGNYITRSYAMFGPDTMRDEWMKKLTGTEEGKVIVRTAREWVRKHVATIPKNLDRTQRPHLEALFDMYVGGKKKVEEMDVDDIRAELEKIRNQLKAEDLEKATATVMDDLITIGVRSKALTKAGQMFRGIKQDITIVSGRNDVPEAIRDLWGEQTDPVMNAFTTLLRQGEFIARIKEQYTLLDDYDGKYFFDTELKGPEGVTLTKLKGDAWGPLEGKFTTPKVKEFLDMKRTAAATWSTVVQSFEDAPATGEWGQATQELGKYALRGLAWAGGKAKWASVVAKPANLVFNFLGSPMQMISNGNFKFTHGFDALALTFKKLPGAAYKSMTDDQIAELVRNNIQDSAFVGELKDAELNALISRFSQGKTKTGAVRRGLDKATDYYAAADLYAKVANYLREKDFVRSFLEAQGKTATDVEIERMASERIQQTNFSFNRAWGPAKMLEQGGITQFLTYNAEVFRTIFGNFSLGWKDIQKAKELQAESPKAAEMLRKHGQLRVIGAGTASAGMTAAAHGIATLLAMAIGAGEDDEKEELIRKHGLPDFLADTVPLLVGINGTERTYFDVGRVDPFGPMNELTRSAFLAATGELDIEEVGKSAWGLIILNAALDTTLQTLGAKNQKQPRVANSSPDVYDWLNQKGQLVMSKEAFDAGLRAAETFAPSVVTTLFNASMAGALEGDDKSGARLFFEAAGVTFNRYRPEKDLARDARNVLGKTMNDSRTQWSNFVASQPELTSEQVSDLLSSINKSEYESWIDMERKVTAAKEAGLNRRQLNEVLKEGSLNAVQRSSLISQRYTPTAISLEKLEQDKASEVKDASGDAKKIQQINKKYRFLRGEVIRLNRNFRDFSEE